MRVPDAQLLSACDGGSRGQTRSASVALVATLIFSLVAVSNVEFFGPRSAHMTLHILTINAIAPLAAMGWKRFASERWPFAADKALNIGFVLQTATLYAWHVPRMVNMGEGRPLFHAAMHLMLLGSAFVFWSAILSLEAAALWRGVIALTLTGKLACLLGALLLLAPRLVYGGADVDVGEALDDQRTAGLIMLAACPFCYLATAVHMASKWLSVIESRAASLCRRQLMKSG